MQSELPHDKILDLIFRFNFHQKTLAWAGLTGNAHVFLFYVRFQEERISWKTGYCNHC